MNVSRRTILRTAAMGTAALPFGALSGNASPVPATPEETIDTLGKQLCDAARALCPALTAAKFFWRRREDGTFEFFVHSEREYERYSGAGFYEVSIGGAVLTFWLERDDIVTKTGYVVEQYIASQYYEGVYEDVRFLSSVNIIRKLEDAPCHRLF